MQYLAKDFVHRTGKRWPAGEHLIQDGAEAVGVGSGPNRLDIATGLFGRHVGGRAHDQAVLRPLGVARPAIASQPEIHDDDLLAVLIDHHIGGLEITVHDALGVRRSQAQRQLANNEGGLPGGDRFGSLPEMFGQGLALHVRHDNVTTLNHLADFMNSAHVGMFERRDRSGLAQKPIDLVLAPKGAPQRDLDGHLPIEPRVSGLIDFSKRSLAQKFENLEPADSLGHRSPGRLKRLRPGGVVLAD